VIKKSSLFFITLVIVTVHCVPFQEFPSVNNKVSRKVITDVMSEPKTEGKPKEKTESANRTSTIT
jgi:hypothetical protein